MTDAAKPRTEDGANIGDEIVFFDLRNLAEKTAVDAQKVYNITQLPPSSPEPTSADIRSRNSKIKRVLQEEQDMSRRMEKRLLDISNIYRISVPSMCDPRYRSVPSGRPSARPSADRLPPLSPSGRMVSAPRSPKRRTPKPHTNPEFAKGSMFRATMEGRARTSSSYREFVGRLSYLINQSQNKINKLYGNSDLSLVMEFLGKESPDHCVYLDSSPSDKMAAFRQQQFCISSTVRKILNKEAKKKKLLPVIERSK